MSMRILLGLFVALALFTPQAWAKRTLPETATPAMWALKDKGADIVFLGSIHMLPPSVKWRTPAIDAAMKRAEIVVLEAPIGDGMGESSKVMARLGTLKEGETLSKVLTKEQWNKLENAAWKVSFPAKNLEPFEPWMASVTLEVMNYVNKGFSPWVGVDMVLEDEAERAGKKLAYLETIEEQIGYLANVPRRIGVKMLMETVKGIETRPDLVFDLLDAWAKGDPAALWKVASDSMTDLPEIEAALLTKRNKNWIVKLEAMAKTGKPHLVVVGAAHLAGPDSVITMLRTKGWKIEGP
jgi:uncharacterized protein